ncbi:MAG TPA: acetyltransferase [Cyclobacteriaceae bacterium]|nr:acetyltransferase [Cyclobacteriaceae bacterium]
MNLAVYGAGGLGREVMLLIEQINMRKPTWDIAGYFDDGKKTGETVGRWKVLGGKQEIGQAGEIAIVIAIADPIIRKEIATAIATPSISFPVVIHPACQTGDSDNRFGKGTILTAGVVLTTGIQLEDFVIINLNTTVGHDVTIGSYSAVMPGCNISGNVKIGEGTLIGTGAKILQNLTIGKNCRVGAGAVVTHDFPDGRTIVGVPAHDK